MSTTVILALFGWPIVVLTLFAMVPPRRAVIVSFLLAWLFLPMAAFKLAEGIPAYSKMSATCWGVLLATAIFDLNRLTLLRPRLADLPMLVWLVCPFLSSLSNGLGAYDGLSATLGQVTTWGLPYFIGRAYFQSSDDLRELAVGLVLGGLIYVPLCLFEIRMSPQLHTWVYGYHQHMFAQTIRFGGYRPTVFMQHGLMVGMWIVNTTLVAWWLWWTGAVRWLWGVSLAWGVGALAITSVLCKSTGAIALMLVGALGLLATRWTGTRWPLIVLLVLAPLYMASRTSGLWDGQNLVTWVDQYLGGERAGSLAVRFEQEDSVTVVALARPWFGWGGWQSGQDQLWLLVFRNQGGVALVCMSLVLSLPLALVVLRYRGGDLGGPQAALAVVLGVVVALYLLDCLFNGMVNPIFMLTAGAVTAVACAPRPLPLTPRAAPAVRHGVARSSAS